MMAGLVSRSNQTVEWKDKIDGSTQRKQERKEKKWAAYLAYWLQPK